MAFAILLKVDESGLESTKIYENLSVSMEEWSGSPKTHQEIKNAGYECTKKQVNEKQILYEII